MNFDLIQFITSVATVAATVSIVYTIMRNVRLDLKDDLKQLRDESIMRSNEIHDRVDRQENRIFQLAMGKSFREIMAEEKQSEEKVKVKSK